MSLPCIITAMVTPFTPDGELDQGCAEDLARWLVLTGSEGIVVAGTTGESPTLSLEERERLYYAVRKGAGSIPIFMGTGSNDTRHTVELSKRAEAWGADGLLIVTPYYNKPPQEGLVRHFVQVAEAVSLPIILYNVPGRTGSSVEPGTVAQIAQRCPNVVAVKEASGHLGVMSGLHQECPDVVVLAGDDALFYPALGLGAHGVVSVAAHVVGPEMVQLLKAYTAGHIAEAREWHFKLEPIFRDLFSWPNPIPVKWVLNRLNIAVGPVRDPLVYPSNTQSLERLHHQVELIWQSREQSQAWRPEDLFWGARRELGGSA